MTTNLVGRSSSSAHASALSRRLVLAGLIVPAVISVSGAAWAACNLIPVAEKLYPSTIGSIVNPISAPGKLVTIRLTPCDSSPGFEPVIGDNTVTLTFQPPGPGADTDVAITVADNLSVWDCDLPGGKCRTLQFDTPNTNVVLPPEGLAGPAKITVRNPATTVVANIGQLFLPASSCDRQAEAIFQQFTVLPVPNSYADAAALLLTGLRATVDGNGDLLVPFDYWGGGTNTVLAETPGAPVAIFLEGGAVIPAQSAGDSNTIQSVLSSQTSPSSFLRSFTLNGRPLPPLLRVTNTGNLFGTADAIESVLRIARNDGVGGPNLFNLSDRLSAGGKGPIIINTFNVAVNKPVPLKALHSSGNTVAYTREEARESANLNSASGDSDQNDQICEIVNSSQALSLNTAMAVTQVLNGPYVASALVTSDSLAAFLESEDAQNSTDINGDATFGDSILRVFNSSGTDLTSSLDEEASILPVVDGHALSISGDKVFFLGPDAFNSYLPVESFGTLETPETAGIVVSPDGNFVYRTSGSSKLVVESRNPVTGALTYVETQAGLDGASGMAISPDGMNLFVAEEEGNALTEFTRDPDTGELFFYDSFADGAVDGLQSAQQVTVTADGKNVYVTSRSDDAVVVFSRDTITGDLTHVETEFSSLDDPFYNIRDIAISPDGLHAYVAMETSDNVAILDRDTITGALTYSDVSGSYLTPGRFVAISPDGANVISTNDGLTNFARNPATGALSELQTFYDGNFGVESFGQPQGVAFSADGLFVYAIGGADAAIAIFRRDPVTTMLSFVETARERLTSAVYNFEDQAVAVSPDGRHVYGQGAGDGFVIGTRHYLKTFDSTAMSMLVAQPAAEFATTSNKRAAILTPEATGGVDLNGDADAMSGGDEVAQLYDASGLAPVLTNLGVAANRTAISDNLVVMTAQEIRKNPLGVDGVDMNGDGDTVDDVVALFPIGSSPPVTILGVSADQIAAVGNRAVFITPEYNEGPTGIGCTATTPPGGCDLNGDGDALDRVIRIYDQTTHQFIELGMQAQEFTIGGKYVAFRTNEQSQNVDLNGDGGLGNQGGFDLPDFTMQVYNLETGVLINTGFTSLLCDLPGCDATTPYKIKGDTLSFLTWERDEDLLPESGVDRNGDGDGSDIVLTVFNMVNERAQFVSTVNNNGNPGDPDQPNPFPSDDVGDGTTVTTMIRESDVNKDLDGDGDIDGTFVVLLAGDIDEDGTFDDGDTCTMVPDDQTDLDGDGLGDVSCDPNPHPCAVEPVTGCRATTIPGKSSLSISDNSDDTKDSLKWAWVKGSETEQADFGDPVSGTAAYALCVYDGSANEQALLGAGVTGSITCSGDACWKATGTKGYKYLDKDGAHGSVSSILLKGGIAGKSKILVKGSGAALGVRDLPVTGPVKVQFVIRDGTSVDCWETNFTTLATNGSNQVKLKDD